MPHFFVALMLLLVAIGDGCGRLDFEELEPRQLEAPGIDGASGAQSDAAVSGTGGIPSGGSATGGTTGTGGATATGGSGPSCTPSNGGVEICDGLDNDCTGGVDDGGACETGCSGRIFQNTSYMFCTSLSLLSAARARCAAAGMRLVRIDSAAENEWVRLTGQMLRETRLYWIGASDVAREGTWLWEDGTQFWMGNESGSATGGRYHNWNSGEPGGGVGESCAQILPTGVWNDTSCINLLGTICKRY